MLQQVARVFHLAEGNPPAWHAKTPAVVMRNQMRTELVWFLVFVTLSFCIVSKRLTYCTSKPKIELYDIHTRIHSVWDYTFFGLKPEQYVFQKPNTADYTVCGD